ncbi:MAG: hypothetical protein ACYDHX_17125 [Methanothrix sp.]
MRRARPPRVRACLRATVNRIEPRMNIGVNLAQEYEMAERQMVAMAEAEALKLQARLEDLTRWRYMKKHINIEIHTR